VGTPLALNLVNGKKSRYIYYGKGNAKKKETHSRGIEEKQG